jgi:hypothetical protein
MAELSETIARAELSSEAVQLFAPGLTADAYTKKLSAAEMHADAVKFAGHAVEAADCIKWSCACLRALQSSSEASAAEAMAAVDAWLAEPGDQRRRASKSAAEKAGLKTAAGCLAMAVFFAEGSIAPAERDSVPGPPGVAQKLASAAVILAVVEKPKEAAERYRQSLALAH